MDSDISDFGKWLLAELGERDWSRARLARQSGVSDGAIKMWIDGTRNISEPYCDVIADTLRISRNEVRRRAGRPETEDDPIAHGGPALIEAPDWLVDNPPVTEEEWNTIRIALAVHRHNKANESNRQ